MSELEEIACTIERAHGCRAEPLAWLPITLAFRNGASWHGIIDVFQLEGHPTATRCYTWLTGAVPSRRITVLKVGAITTAEEAVQTWLRHPDCAADAFKGPSKPRRLDAAISC
jgi:hypothetical protein